MQDGNCKNNARAKFCRGKVHNRMLAGDPMIWGAFNLGDFGEIEDWIPGTD